MPPTVVITSTPVGMPVNGSNSTFNYPTLSRVTLTCMVDPLPLLNVTYQWITTECYTNINYNDGGPRCFPHDQTTQNVTGYLTAEDAGSISCAVNISHFYFTSMPYVLQISG